MVAKIKGILERGIAMKIEYRKAQEIINKSKSDLQKLLDEITETDNPFLHRGMRVRERHV